MPGPSRPHQDISHPPLDQLPNLEYCIDSNPPWPEAIALGFQHYVLMLGTTVMIPTFLVPRMGGDDGDKAQVIQTLLFVAGINTLIQTILGSRLPAVIGGSYAFMIPAISIINSASVQTAASDKERFLSAMCAIQGALISSSSLQIILGFSGLWGVFSRFLSPLGAAPLITLVGLGLFELGFPGVAKCIEIGLLELMLFTALTLYLKHISPKGFPLFERFPILLSVPIIWAFSSILTVGGAYKNSPSRTKHNCRADAANLIASAPWFKVPYPLQWGAPTFDGGHTFAMMASAFVSLAESTGAFYALSRLASATPPPAHVLSRGMGWQGVGLLLDGLFGTVTGSTVSVENAGLLGITRVGSRRVVQISAVFMIFFSILGKFGALFASVPFPLFSAMYCILFGIVAATGISFLQFTNMNSLRSLFIFGFSLYLGLSVPQYFNEYSALAGYGPVRSNAIWFNDILDTIFTSSATVALIVAVLLDNTVNVREAKKDRGMPWWVNFRAFRDDNRSEEFYSLPFNLHKYFPPA